jgi:WD40 repeat protein
VHFSADGTLLAALSHGWQVAIWDVRTGRLQHILDVPKGVFADNAALAFSPDGRQFAFATGGEKTGEAPLWDLSTGQKLRSWILPPSLQDTLAFHPSGKLLLYRVET